MDVSALYHDENVIKKDDARVQLFNKCKALEVVPPTSDALHGHIERAHYQTLNVGQYSTSSCDYVHIWLKL